MKKKNLVTINLGKKGTIKIHEGTFTAKAKKHGKTAEEFMHEVLSNKGKYDSKTVKQATLMKTMSKWDK